MASSRTDITDEVRANAYRAAAEPAYRATLSAAPPGYLPGESIAAYRVRLATGLKPFSQTYKTVADRSLAQMYHAGALHNAEATIYAEAERTAKRSSGPLREVIEPDRTGRQILKFYGDPEQTWAPFKQTPRMVARFNVKDR